MNKKQNRDEAAGIPEENEVPAEHASPASEEHAPGEGGEPRVRTEGAAEGGDLESESLEDKDNAELLDRLRRLGADFQNYKKRVQKEISRAREFANESLLRELLPVLDDMELALESAEANRGEDDPLLKGMTLVHDKLLDVLQKNGLSRIQTIGREFDPEKHSALMQEATDDVPPWTVLRELQKGYCFKSRTLRAATVVVSRALDSDAGDGESAAENGVSEDRAADG